MKPTFKIVQWTNEFIHPSVLINGKASSEDLLKLESGFLNQLKNYIEAVFGRTNLSKRHALIHIRQLVSISNTIYGYLFRLSPVWKRHISFSHLRSTYLHLLIALEKAINTIGQIEPEAYSKIPVTLYHNSCIKMCFKETIKGFLNALSKLSIDDKLCKVLERYLNLFLNSKEVTQSEIDFVTNLIRQIEINSNMDTFQLVELLYLHGFNAREFFYFYSNSLNKRLQDITNLHDQIQTVINEQDRLDGLPAHNGKMFPRLAPIDGQFKNFLLKKEKHLTETLNLRRTIIQDEQFSKTTSRLKIFLSVAQLGLLIRLFIEKGLLAKENIGELFTFFATHFSTPQTQYISSDSLRKKSTDVEFSTAHKLKGHLITMLNWLNENYNLSNYKNS